MRQALSPRPRHPRRATLRAWPLQFRDRRLRPLHQMRSRKLSRRVRLRRRPTNTLLQQPSSNRRSNRPTKTLLQAPLLHPVDRHPHPPQAHPLKLRRRPRRPVGPLVGTQWTCFASSRAPRHSHPRQSPMSIVGSLPVQDHARLCILSRSNRRRNRAPVPAAAPFLFCAHMVGIGRP